MLKSYFQVFAYDPEMSYLRQSRRRRSRSFVQGFLKLHFRLFEASTSLDITDIDGATATLNIATASYYAILRATAAGRSGGNAQNFYLPAAAFISSDQGIVVGTGTTAVTPTDYQLATQILDGTSSGTLEHFPSSGTGLTISNPTGSFTLERIFRNSSSGSITINEVGVYVASRNTNAQAAICVIRDLVSPGFTVANGEYMRVIYTLSVTA
jgi:hypothetical protein